MQQKVYTLFSKMPSSNNWRIERSYTQKFYADQHKQGLMLQGFKVKIKTR